MQCPALRMGERADNKNNTEQMLKPSGGFFRKAHRVIAPGGRWRSGAVMRMEMIDVYGLKTRGRGAYPIL